MEKLAKEHVLLFSFVTLYQLVTSTSSPSCICLILIEYQSVLRIKNARLQILMFSYIIYMKKFQ
jgi:hypothetical protein